jgi:hypothetical protein
MTKQTTRPPRKRFGLRNIATGEVVKVLHGRADQVTIQKQRPGHSWFELPAEFDQTKHVIDSLGKVRSKPNG